jgi:hypothetical protein
MPSRSSSSSSSSGSSSSSSIPKSSLKFEVRLTGKSSFDHWLYQLGNWAYGKGKVYDDMFEQGLKGDPNQDPDPNAQGFNSDERRNMWATVILTLDADEVKKVRTVRRGNVEKLIRAIAKMYDEKSEVNLDTMRKKIQTCRLHAFADLNAFFAQHEEYHKGFEDYKEKLTLGNMRFHMLAGLPSEYEPAKTALTLPNASYTWEEMKDYLRGYCARTKNCPGEVKDKNSKVFTTSDAVPQQQEACRNFARGKCKRGSGCRFSHAQHTQGVQGSGESKSDAGQGACFNCGKTGHLVANCTKPCGFCNEKGHSESACKDKKAAAKAIMEAKERAHATTTAPAAAAPVAAQQPQAEGTFCNIEVEGLPMPVSFTFCTAEEPAAGNSNAPASSIEILYDDYRPTTAAVTSQKAAAPEAAALAPHHGGALLDGESTVAKLRRRFPCAAHLFVISILISVFALLNCSYFSYSTDFDARTSMTFHENYRRKANMSVVPQPADFSLFDDEPHSQMCGPFRLPKPGGGCGTFRALANDYEEIDISPLQKTMSSAASAPYTYENDQSTPAWAEVACLLFSVIYLFSLPAAIFYAWIHKRGASIWRSTRRLLRRKFPIHRSSDWPGTCRFPSLQFRLPAVKGSHSRGRFGT